jgi:hypothetical protein
VTALDPNDPLVCLNFRAAGEPPTCLPNRGHCVRCQLCKHACECRTLTTLDEQHLATALDAYARHAGATDWDTFADRVPQHVADNAYECVLAGAEPLLAEIRRLTTEADRLRAQVQELRAEVNRLNRLHDERDAIERGRLNTKENS